MTSSTGPDTEKRLKRANELIGYHSPISKAKTAERTSYSSQLIPVTAYILVACAEAFHRYPEMLRIIDAAMRAEEIGRRGHRPGSNINSVYLWSVANFWLTGRKIVTSIDPSLDDPDAAYTVLDFWSRAAGAFRHDDGTRQACDAGDVVLPYPQGTIDTLLSRVIDIPLDESGDSDRARVKRFNATLVNYLFLLYFDTRVGSGDSGPYLMPDGRVLLVRDFYRLSQSDFWWSYVANEIPYHHLTAAMVLEDVAVRVTDWGSCITEPEDYLDRLVGFSLFTTDTPDGSLKPVALEAIDELVPVVQRVNGQLYRNVAAMTRLEMIRCGAYVYFSFLKPFAEAAGVADQLDWTVPKALPDTVFDLISRVNGEDVSFDEEAEYYLPLNSV